MDELVDMMETSNVRIEAQQINVNMAKLIEEGHFQAAKYILDGNDYAPTEKHELDMSATITVDYGEDDEG